LWVASLGAVAVLALGVTGTLSQFVASINNTNNNASTVGPEAFAFSESNVLAGVPQSPACATASAGQSVNCTTINKYGTSGTTAPPMAPGSSQSTTVQLKNEATGATGLSGNLTLTVSPCTQNVPVGDPNPSNGGTAAGDLCGTLNVAVTCSSPGTASVFTGTLTAFATGSPYSIATSLPPGDFTDCTFTTTLPATATAANLQGLSVSQPLTWTWTQV
jgi:hypothetical protein